MNLNITESCLFQKLFQLSIPIDRHIIDDLCPLVVLVRITIALIADEESTARLQQFF